MLMMFGHALYKAPFERAMPFNDRDLMILVSPEYGIRLCNITTEQGETFEIKSFMISKKDVFNCEDFDMLTNALLIRIISFFKPFISLELLGFNNKYLYLS